MRALEAHRDSHGKLFECDVCSKTFGLKTSLINHSQVHLDDVMHCSKPGCEKVFKHHQNHLEHVRWGHHDKKECPCNVCSKLFQTPTNMHAHRVKIHGFVEELLPGHPNAAKACKQCEAMAKRKAEELKKKYTSKSHVKPSTSTSE